MMDKLRRHPLAAALPLTALLVALAFFLPAQFSQWNDRSLLNKPVVLRGEDRDQFAESVRLTVPEKLLLLRSGSLSWLDLEEAGEGRARVTIVEGTPQVSAPEEPEAERPALSEEERSRTEESGQTWSRRLAEVQTELKSLYGIGALPALWSDTDTVELTSQREGIYIDPNSGVSFTMYYMELSGGPYTVGLAVDGETGRIMSLTLRWTQGSAPAWGITGARNFGSAWRDYWGMDSVDAVWRSQYIQGILEDLEGQVRGSELISSAEVDFTYNGQDLVVQLVCRTGGSSRLCAVQWNPLV